MLVDHARVLAVALRDEFETEFVLQDAATGDVIHGAEAGAEPLSVEQVSALVARGQATVTLQDSGYRVSMPLYAAGRLILVATASVAPAAGQHVAREHTRLARWAQSVCERLRSADYIRSRARSDERTQVKAPWEALLRLDRALRHTRAYRTSDEGRRRVLDAVFDLLDVDSLVWLPADPAANIVTAGGVAREDCRALAPILAQLPELNAAQPLLCNDVAATAWGASFPTLANLMAFAVADGKPLGWIVALNKRTAAGELTAFRHSDAALLTPFVALLSLQTRTAARYHDLKELLVGLTRSLTSALDAKDAYTWGHSERVARIAVELGRELSLDEDELGNIYLAGLLHDIGKIGVPDAILCKAGPLAPEEFEQIKRHVTVGHAILADLKQLRDILPGVLHHHEQYNGRGYPAGLAEETIPLVARILAVADAYDAMSTTRPYRTAMAAERVEAILTQGAGTQWDARVIEAFLRCRPAITAIRQRGIGDSLFRALNGALSAGDSASVAITPKAESMTAACPATSGA